MNLGLSAHANACAHYDNRRKHLAKHAKTLAANDKALKTAEKKALAQLQQVPYKGGGQVDAAGGGGGQVQAGSWLLGAPLLQPPGTSLPKDRSVPLPTPPSLSPPSAHCLWLKVADVAYFRKFHWNM